MRTQVIAPPHRSPRVIALALALAALVALLGMLARPNPPTLSTRVSGDPALAAAARPLLRGALDRASIAVIDGDTVAYAHFGASDDTTYEIGSITKTFTGTVLADMVRRGEVGLDDPVARYLPAGVRVPSLNGRAITLLDLATHTSGLPRLPTGYVPPDPANPYAGFAAEHLYAFLGRYALEREPGSKFEYSNLGMGLLGHALARAAGAKSFQALVARRVLRPLGLSMTAYGRAGALAPWMTRGHDRQGALAPPFDVAVLAGGGGLNSTAADLLTYLEANIGEPKSPLERAMRDARRGRHVPRRGIQVGLGWMTMTRGPLTLVGHNGGTAGYSTYVAFDPATRAGVVVLANSGDFDYADKIGRELLDPERRPLVAGPEPAKAAAR